MSPRRSEVDRRRRAAELVVAVTPTVRATALPVLGEVETEGFVARLEQHGLDVVEPLEILYGERTDLATLVAEVVQVCVGATVARPGPLRVLDRRREVDSGWFQRARTVGYVAYADRFAGDLRGVRDRIDYLAELGISYLHLMPLLRPRDGENDGGYAVADYRSVDPRLGSMSDLEQLAEDLHARGMSLCIDLVLNHTAAEHPWAVAARAGDPRYRDYFLVYPDRSVPDAFERTLPEVFPTFAHGSFTLVPELGWVWTTFTTHQWDLNWANPRVFVEMLDTMLFLANRGVDVLRLDAVPFMWKRMGTDCQNQPEVHLLLQALRALVKVAAPGVAFKAEAIVPPEQLVQYLGAHERHLPECDLAYNNQLMVMLWSSLASRDARLASTALRRLRPTPPETGWVTYVRNHDDIGWAVSDIDAASVGWSGQAHRRFLNDFYTGGFEGSFARGEPFQVDEVTGDARVSGMTASLCGVSAALASADTAELDRALRRLELLYSIAYSFGGIPLVYMGDEIALGDDLAWASVEEHAADSRWLHRPSMDWTAAARRGDRGTVEGRAFVALQSLGVARRSLVALRSGGTTTVLDAGNERVLAYRRQSRRGGAVVALACFSDEVESVAASLVDGMAWVHGSDEVRPSEGRLGLPAWGYAWFAEDASG